MKKKKFTALELSLFVIPALIIVLPFLLRSNSFMESELLHPVDKARRSSCQSNLKMITLAIAQYSTDMDDRMPFSSSPPTSVAHGWADAIHPYINPYLGGNKAYQCPSETTPTVTTPTSSGYTDYWYNGKLSGATFNWNSASSMRKSILYPAATLMLGEGSDGIDITDARYSKSSLPPIWLNSRSKPPWRHLGGANYAFVDGHVKWLRPNQVLHWGGRANSFSIK